MGKQITIGNRTFYEPTLRMRRGTAYIRFYDPTKSPKQRELSLHTRDKSAADILFHQRRFEYLNGTYDPWRDNRREGVDLDYAIGHYLENQDVRASSIKSKERRLRPFARRTPGIQLVGITEDHVRSYCYRGDLKQSTQQRYAYELRHFFEHCIEQGWRSENPASLLLKNTPRHRKRQMRTVPAFLQPEEVQMIIEAIEADTNSRAQLAGRQVLADIVRFAALTGMRLSEICNLKWSHVTLSTSSKGDSRRSYGWIVVTSEAGALTKTGDEGRVPIVAQCYHLLEELKSKKRSSYVFPAPSTAKRINKWWVSDRFRLYRRRVGLPENIHFHSLRHTCASWLAMVGTDLKVIQEVMRHSSLKQTLAYAHLQPDTVADKMNKAYDAIDFQ